MSALPATESFDVVVVGSGGAGLRAAIAAREAGASVLVVAKGMILHSGATGSANFSYCASFGRFGPEDTPERFASDVMAGGQGRGDPRLALRLAEEAGHEADRLAAWGMPWTHDADGKRRLASFAGHAFPRAIHVDLRTGKVMMAVLARRARAVGCVLRAYAFALDLLVADGRVTGVVMLDLPTGEIRPVAAGAVVLATGGAMEMFRLQTNPAELTGDGIALAWRAGADLVDMEFFQFYPTVFVNPPGARGVHLPSGRLLDMGARLVNARGEAFFERHAEGPVNRATRDTLARAIAKEVLAGGGTPKGGVFLDATHLPEAEVRAKFVDSYFRDLGVDPCRAPQEIAPAPHYMLGGIAIDPDGRTTLAGLFAAGETAGGVHGANRLTGNALPEIVVFGAAAGRAAATDAARARRGAPDPEVVRSSAARAEAILARGARGPDSSIPTFGALRARLQAVMGAGAGVLKSATGLEAALAALDRLERDDWPRARLVLDDRVWNWEWMEALELANMLTVARLHLRAALARQESVGAHVRLDFPAPDPTRFAAPHRLRRGPRRARDRASAAVSAPLPSPPHEVVVAVTVPRRRPSEARARRATYTVRIEPGASVLQLLAALRAQHDSGFSFPSHNCKLGSCGVCALRIDGRSGLACRVLVDGRPLRIEPLRQDGVVVDLLRVVEEG